MYQKLKLIAYQFHPCIFSNDSDDDDEEKETVNFNAKSHMDNLNIVFKYYWF